MSRRLEAVHRRRDFASLAASRTRARSGPVRVVREALDEGHEVAYGIGRPVGTAVARNRVRRRLRVLMDECHDEQLLPAGRYLVSVGPTAADVAFDELRRHLRSALADLP